MNARSVTAAFLLAGCVALPAAAQNAPEATAAAQRYRASQAAASAPARSAKMAPAKASAASAKAPHDTSKTAASAAAARPPGPAPLDAQGLAACKNEAGLNFIKRERCVYAHCKGHWGEGDCPPGQDMPTGQSMKEGITQPFKQPDPAPQTR